MTRLALIVSLSLSLSLSLRMAQEPAAREASEASELVLFHPSTLTGGEEQVVRQVQESFGIGVRLSVHEDSELGSLAGPSAGDDRRIQAYHAMQRTAQDGTWTLSFVRSEGVVRIEAFDDEYGVRAMSGTKIRSVSQDRLSEEHLARLSDMLREVHTQLADKKARASRSRASPYCETVSWRTFEDRPEPGFRWVFEPMGPRVTFVYETSSIESAGLRVGDLLEEINGRSVPSPPHLGRALGPLRIGEALKLVVLRGETTVTLTGAIESSAELIPRWQVGMVGKELPLLARAIAADEFSSLEIGGRVVLVVVYSPGMPETWESFSVLRWIRDHYSDQELVILGVAANTDAQALSGFLDEVKPGWPSIPDPDGEFGDALRVQRPPAFLLLDRRGVLQFRQVDEADLCQAIETLRSAR